MKKGVIPVISYTLLVAIIVITTSAAYFWAYPHMEKLGEGAKSQTLLNQMQSMDYIVRQVAHGSIGFQNSVALHLPEGNIMLDDEHNKIVLTYQQETSSIGQVPRPEEEEITFSCEEGAEYINHTQTGILARRAGDYTHVYTGAAGAPGTAHVTLCYSNIDLQWKERCIQGRGGPKTEVLIEKVDIDNKPVVEIDFC